MRKLPITKYAQSFLLPSFVSSVHAAYCDMINLRLLFPPQSARDDLQRLNENLSGQIEKTESEVARLKEHIKQNDDIRSANEKAAYYKVCSVFFFMLPSLCLINAFYYYNNNYYDMSINLDSMHAAQIS